MFAICDVKEYRKCVTAKGGPLVSQLFDVLHALCNLLLVKHENLQEVCGGETLVGSCLGRRFRVILLLIVFFFALSQINLDKSVVLNFIQLRSDYKTIKISNSLKGISEQRI